MGSKRAAWAKRSIESRKCDLSWSPWFAKPVDPRGCIDRQIILCVLEFLEEPVFKDIYFV